MPLNLKIYSSICIATVSLFCSVTCKDIQCYDRESIAECLGQLGATEVFNDLLETSFDAWRAKNRHTEEVSEGLAALINRVTYLSISQVTTRWVE